MIRRTISIRPVMKVSVFYVATTLYQSAYLIDFVKFDDDITLPFALPKYFQGNQD